MKPKLVAVAGEFNGNSYSIPAAPLAIGSSFGNDLILKDPLVSRAHCIISKQEESILVRDLGSTNGTFVNQLPVRERILAHGDTLTIGSSCFILVSDEEKNEIQHQAIQIEKEPPISKRLFEIEQDDLKQLQNLEKSKSETTDSDYLQALLEISRVASAVRKNDELRTRLLELILKWIPAERGVLVLINQNHEEYTTLYSRRKAILEGPIPVSRTILDKVLRERKALLSRHILHSEFRKSKSLYTAGVESVLSIPLTVGEKLLGGIYLETSEPNGFDKRHLDLLATVGGTAALAFENSAQFERLEAETRRLKEDLGYQNNMVGESPAIKGVLKVISRVAATQATVMITGESGTGKELAARAIHINSIRSEFPFVVINCAAITESLLESELFGHEKGAFTGAIRQKKGKIEIADGGTLFLDEIGELALPLQSKLLRFVQEMEFERIGGLQTLKVDVRLIAATNLDLKSAVLQGSFREDLYYRLNVVTIEMPPLRERAEDIPLLAQYFVSKFNRAGRRVQGISKEALRLLTQYHWPGNIRELQNVIERAVALGNREQIETSDLPQSLHAKMEHTEKRPLNFHTAIEKQKKDLIVQAVAESNGNITRAAKLLELQPTYLHRLIKNLSLRDEIRKTR